MHGDVNDSREVLENSEFVTKEGKHNERSEHTKVMKKILDARSSQIVKVDSKSALIRYAY